MYYFNLVMVMFDELCNLVYGYCCNLTDHIRLPITNTKTYINIKERQETRTDRIKQIIIVSPYNAEN